MESNKVNTDVVVVIDKEKLPEYVRKLLEEKLSLEEQPKLSQEKVLKMLGRTPPDNKSDNRLEDNKLFAIQTGSVIGNIYTDGIYKREEDSYVKKKDINHLGGCL